MTLKDTMMPLMSSFHVGGTSPASRGGYQPANSPGPNGLNGPNGHDIYAEHGYVQAASPQPSGIQMAMNRVSLTIPLRVS
jgi:hypothetical protein